MQEIFGKRFTPVFTPPWNRLSNATLKILQDLEFAGVSGGQTFPQRTQAPIVLKNLRINIDLHTRNAKDGVADFDVLLDDLGSLLVKRDTIGIMLHHHHMNRFSFDFLDELIGLFNTGPGPGSWASATSWEISMASRPSLVYADGKGKIFDWPELEMTGRSGTTERRLHREIGFPCLREASFFSCRAGYPGATILPNGGSRPSQAIPSIRPGRSRPWRLSSHPPIPSCTRQPTNLFPVRPSFRSSPTPRSAGKMDGSWRAGGAGRPG